MWWSQQFNQGERFLMHIWTLAEWLRLVIINLVFESSCCKNWFFSGVGFLILQKQTMSCEDHVITKTGLINILGGSDIVGKIVFWHKKTIKAREVGPRMVRLQSRCDNGNLLSWLVRPSPHITPRFLLY